MVTVPGKATNNVTTVSKDIQIDFDFISGLEGGRRLKGYVPTPNSGGTFATGFDMKDKDFSTLIGMGMDPDIAAKLAPVAGLKGAAARRIAEQIELTEEEASHIDKVAKSFYVNDIARQYKAITGQNFYSLPPAAQTIVFSVGYQYGRLSRTPKFMKAFADGDLLGVVNELNNFGDQYGPRREQEAKYLEAALLSNLHTEDEPIVSEDLLQSDPARVAEARNLSRKIGIPSDVITRNKDELVSFIQKNEAEEVLAQSPTTARFLQISDENTAIASKDIDKLSAIEHTLRAGAAFIGGQLQVLGGTLSGLGNMWEMIGRGMSEGVYKSLNIIGGEDFEKAVRNVDKNLGNSVPWYLKPSQIIARPGEQVKNASDAISPDDPSFIEKVLGGVGQMSAQWAMAFASGGFASMASASALFAQGVDITAEEAKLLKAQGKEVPEWKGDLAQVLGGTVTAVTEKYGLNIIFNKIPAAARNRMLRILMGAGSEAAQEVLEQFGHNLALLYTIDPNRKVFEGWEEDATVAGTVGAIVEAALPSKRAARMHRAVQEAREITQETVLKDVALDIAADHMAEVLQDAGIDEVRLSARRTVEWAEKAPDGVLETLNRLGIADQMEQALAAGDEIVIDGKTFAREVMISDNYESVADHVRFRANLPTLDEALQDIVQHHKELLEVLEKGDIEETLAKRTKRFLGQFMSKKEGLDVADILRHAPDDVLQVVDTLVEQVKERAGVADKIIVEGRLQAIDKELSTLDKDIISLSNEIEEREQKGLSNKQRQDRLNKLIAKQDELLSEQSELGLPSKPAAVQNPAETVSRKSKVVTTAGKLQNLNVSVTKQSIRDIRKGFSEGRKAARKDVKEAQTILQTLIQKSGLSQSDKAKFLTTLKSIQTSDQLWSKMPLIQDRVVKLLEKDRKKQLTASLKKTLKRQKTKNQGGKPVGRLTPEISKFVDNLSTFSRLKKQEAAEVLAQRLETGGGFIGENFSPAIAYENAMLGLISDPDSVNADRVEEMLLALNETLETGRAINSVNLFARMTEADRLREEFLELTVPEPTKRISKARKAKEIIQGRLWLGLSGAWWNKLQHVLVSSDRARVDKLIDKLSLFDENRKHEVNKHNRIEKFRRLAMEKTRLTERQLLKRFQKDMTEEVTVGTFTHAVERKPILEGKKTVGFEISKGKVKTITMTRAELRKRVMEMRNPQLNELARDPETEGYTDEIIDAMNGALDETDHQIIDAQLEFYADYYDSINEVYEKVYGVSLPFVEQYVPIRRDFTGNASDEFLKSILYRGGVVPGSLKSRKPSKLRLKQIGDIEILQSHIMEMEYFIAYAEKVRLLNNVFAGDHNKIMNRITDTFGEAISRTMQSDLGYFANKGVTTSMTAERLFVRLMRNFGFAQLGAKPQIGLKQFAVFSAFSEDVSVKDFTAGILQFSRNPRAALRFMNEHSSLFRLRGIDLDNDFKDLTADALSGRFTNFMGRNPSFTKIMMLPIRYGDKAALLVGGYAHIQAKMRQGSSVQDAVRSFEVLTSRTQQSSDPDQISELQRENALARVIAQFMSGANAMTRAEITAFGELMKGRIGAKEFSKRFFVYHLLIPNLMMFLTNGFNWDEEDQVQASILGSFNGLFVLGEALEVAYSYATGAERPFNLEGRHPIQLIENLFIGLTDDDIDDISWEDFVEGNRSIDRVARFTSELTGIPVTTLLNQMRGFAKVADGDFEEGFALMIGYSPYVIEKNEIGQ